MNPIDLAINYAFPGWGMRRSVARQALNSYKGGIPTRTSEFWDRPQGFRFGTTSDRQQQTDARGRAYQAYRNNPVARTLVNVETDNVIGDGLNYQPTSSSPEWNAEAKDRYYKWLEECSVRGPDIHTGCELQRLLWTRSRVAGDVGWILVAQGAESRIQVVRAENISTPDGKYSDRTVYDGIRFDGLGRPVEFYVLSNDEYGKRDWATVPARDFVFLPHMSDEGQARGETCYLTIFDLLAHLDRYVDGVSLAAWMGTVMGLIFKQKSAATQLSALGTVTNSQGDQQKAITLENGMVKYIGTDEDVAQVQAHQPLQQTPEFIRAMYRMLGQPFQMPLEVMALDMSTVNFASARIGLLPFYRHCRINAAKFGSRWSRTIRWWLSREAQRADGDPRKWKTAFPADYWNHDLLPNEWDYTDPVSEAQADMLQIDMGTKSRSMVIAERGRDMQLIDRQRNEDADAPEIHSTMTRDPTPDPVAPAADPNAVDPELERIKAEADAYGVAVRAGVVTPQTDDENAFREKLALPPMSADTQAAWKKDEGTRRPITLAPPPGEAPATPFGGKPAAAEPAPADDSGDAPDAG